MVNKLFFEAGNELLCSYVVDALGCLVLRSGEGNPDSLIPYAMALATPADELAHPFPWSITEEKVLGMMVGLPDHVRSAPSVSAVIEQTRLERFGFPLVPLSAEHAHDTELEAGLKLMDTLPAGSVEISQLEDLLKRGGLIKIPRIDRYVSEIHIRTNVAGPFQVISDGWMTSMKVFRRSVVQCDQDKASC